MRWSAWFQTHLRACWASSAWAGDDSFFDRGGFSFLALSLFATLEKTLGRNLPLVLSLSEHQTVAQFAAFLRTRDFFRTWPVAPTLRCLAPGLSKSRGAISMCRSSWFPGVPGEWPR